MTPAQVRTLQTARRRLRLGEPQYRIILRNTGGVGSSTQLTHRGFEQVMAVMEEMGFQRPDDPTYWRDRTAGHSATSRAAWMIRQLAAQQGRYPLAALVHGHSEGRTDDPDKLTPQEAYRLTEMLKGVVARAERSTFYGQLFATEPTPAAEGSAAGAVTDDPARTPATATDGDRQEAARNAPAAPAARMKTPAVKGPFDPVTDDEIPF